MPKDPNEIGALWLKERDGKKWLSGKINGQNVVVFRNKNKTGKQPDYRVLLARKREESEATDEIRGEEAPF